MLLDAHPGLKGRDGWRSTHAIRGRTVWTDYHISFQSSKYSKDLSHRELSEDESLSKRSNIESHMALKMIYSIYFPGISESVGDETQVRIVQQHIPVTSSVR